MKKKQDNIQTSKEMDSIEIMHQNINQMNILEGYDIIILCSSNEIQAEYWQKRFEKIQGQIIPESSKIISVHEDWEGGAGNGLGTLYAFQKACKISQTNFNLNLFKQLSENKISVSLYHTAGKGTRLAPLPGAENNNKPGVKLPTCIQIDNISTPLSILEAVIKQTSVYAPYRKGRLSVYWGDQVFIPSVPIHYKPLYHIDILCKLGPMPDADTWIKNGFEKYGLIAINESGNGAQIEKVSHTDACHLLKNLGKVKNVGISLGSFSISSEMLKLLFDCFSLELKTKTGKYDTDPHFWMPFTLSEKGYVHLMKKKDIPEDESKKHYSRMQTCLKSLPKDCKIFGPVDIGMDSYWWDYGQLKLYFSNNMRIIDSGQESMMYRKFFRLPENTGSIMQSFLDLKNIQIDQSSILSFSSLEKGIIHKSVLNNIYCQSLQVDTSILINVTAKSIKTGKNCLVYNVIDETEKGIVLNDNEVLVGIFNSEGKQRLIRSTLEHDGGIHWKHHFRNDQPSFEEIYKENISVNINEIEKIKNKEFLEKKKHIQLLNQNGKFIQ